MVFCVLILVLSLLWILMLACTIYCWYWLTLMSCWHWWCSKLVLMLVLMLMMMFLKDMLLTMCLAWCCWWDWCLTWVTCYIYVDIDVAVDIDVDIDDTLCYEPKNCVDYIYVGIHDMCVLIWMWVCILMLMLMVWYWCIDMYDADNIDADVGDMLTWQLYWC